MRTYEATASIDAETDEVWRVLADVQRWNSWTPTVEKVTALAGGELAVGRKFQVFQPKLRPAVWTVTELRPGTVFVWESRAPGILMVASHSVARVAPGATSLRLTFSFQGLVGAVVARVYRALVESYLQTEASSLKRRVELAGQGAQRVH